MSVPSGGPIVASALLSVSDRSGLGAFSARLAALGIELVASSGTAAHLRELGIPVREVSQVYGRSGMMGGRLKTLDARIHTAILARRDDRGDMDTLARLGILPVDMVVCNFYPFPDPAGRLPDSSGPGACALCSPPPVGRIPADGDGTTRQASTGGAGYGSGTPGEGVPSPAFGRFPAGELYGGALEMIDIGGPALLRSAAKNCVFVAPVPSPECYESVAEELETSGRRLSERTRLELARRVFAETSAFDAGVLRYFDALCGAASAQERDPAACAQPEPAPDQSCRPCAAPPGDAVSDCAGPDAPAVVPSTKGAEAPAGRGAARRTSGRGNADTGHRPDGGTSRESVPAGSDRRIVLAPVEPLLYGENPHQRAWIYGVHGYGADPEPEPQARPEPGADASVPASGAPPFRLLAGRELSFNNLLDVDGGVRSVSAFGDPAVAVVKHGCPCGLALSRDPVSALSGALDGDRRAAFGGVVVSNSLFCLRSAVHLKESGVFIQVVAAPAFEDEALQVLSRSRRRRLLELDGSIFTRSGGARAIELRSALSVVLAQEPDLPLFPDDAAVAGAVAVPDEAWAQVRFAWKSLSAVRSNGVVLARDYALVGVGSGMACRADAVRQALFVAGDRAGGAVLASDGFFPFADAVELAASGGVAGIVQPGGSRRDAEVVAAADRAGLFMVFTGRRVFRH